MKKYVNLPLDMIIDLNGPMKELLNLDMPKIKEETPAEQIKTEAPIVNFFQIPEKLLRKPKLFALPEEFDVWIQSKKRKSNKEEMTQRKLMKMSGNWSMLGDEFEDDESDFYGFDESGCGVTLKMRLSLSTIGNDSQLNDSERSMLLERSMSQDSGIQTEKANQAPEGDSGIVADMESINESGVIMSESNANSTQIDGKDMMMPPSMMDSGFSEMESSFQSEKNLSGQPSTSAGPETTLPSTSNINEPIPSTSTANNHNADHHHANDDRPILQGEFISTIQPSKDAIIIPQSISDFEEDEEATAEMQAMCDRVGEWHKNLQPVLAHSEKRNHFDVHELGSDIINLFPSENKDHEVSFSEVMTDRDQSYTARYFLSLLLLTNTKNVSINVVHPENNGKRLCPKDELKIKLLSTQRHYDDVSNIHEIIDVPRADKNAVARPLLSANVDTDDEDCVYQSKKGAKKLKTKS